MPRVYKNTPYFKSTKQMKILNRKKLQSYLENFIEYADRLGLSIDSLVLVKKRDNVEKKFKLSPKSFLENNDETDEEKMFRFQKIKDLCNLSEKRYEMLRKEGKLKHIMPSINKCNLMKAKLNEYFTTTCNDYGFYLSNPSIKIELAVKEFYTRNREAIKDNKIILKIACDGTNITSKNVKQLNLAFTIINDEKNAMSIHGNMILGMFKIDIENYDTLKFALKEIFNKLKCINNIEIDGKNFIVEQFQGGDMKNLAILYGINSANSNKPCIWCKWDKTSRLNVKEKWEKRSIRDSLIEIGQNGYVKEPLTYIDFDHCAIDVLHCVIRFIFLK